MTSVTADHTTIDRPGEPGDSTTDPTNTTTTTKALERISVRAPYFDLGPLTEIGDGMLTAAVDIDGPSATESGPVAADQVARHLAILGSCAAALKRDDDARHHYLATRAHYTRLANAPLSVDEPLRAEALGCWIDRRTARAMIKLGTESGRGLNVLDVEYTVLAPRMFNRLHPPLDPDTLIEAERTDDMPFEPVLVAGGARVDCGLIPASFCQGHFDDYPAAPVALVMGRLCRTAGAALAQQLGYQDLRYRIEEGLVSASKLARAGQRLTLRADYVQPVRGGHQLRGSAEADGDLVGEVTVTMSATNVPDPIPFGC